VKHHLSKNCRISTPEEVVFAARDTQKSESVQHCAAIMADLCVNKTATSIDVSTSPNGHHLSVRLSLAWTDPCGTNLYGKQDGVKSSWESCLRTMARSQATPLSLSLLHFTILAPTAIFLLLQSLSHWPLPITCPSERRLQICSGMRNDPTFRAVSVADKLASVHFGCASTRRTRATLFLVSMREEILLCFC